MDARSVQLDNSLRFFDYVMKQPGMATYLNPRGKKVVGETRVFRFRCIPVGEYIKSIENTVLGSDGLDQEYSVLPPRKLVPPQFTEAEADAVGAALKDPGVAYVVFPCLWQEFYPADCKKSAGTGRVGKRVKNGGRKDHMVLFALNKAKGVVELWDDQYAKTQIALSYDDTALQPLPFLRPLLRTFGVEIGDKIDIPMFDSEKHGGIKEILERPVPVGGSRGEGGKGAGGATFHEIYMSFLANYIRKRVEEFGKLRGEAKATRKAKTKTMKEMAAVVVPRIKNRVNRYLDCYDGLRRHNDLWPHTNANVFVYQNPHMALPVACETGKYRNVASGECVDFPSKVSLPVGKFDKGKRARKSNLMSYFYYVFMYFSEKHPSAAMIVPPNKMYPPDDEYCMIFRYKDDKKGRNRFDIERPRVWDKFMTAAVANERVRFIVVPVLIRGRIGKGHINMLVIDKHRKVVERYEPNTGIKEDTRWGNGRVFDYALEEYFAKKDTTPTAGRSSKRVSNPFAGYRYSGAEETCPRGLHRYEYHENTSNVFDTGGNCALWSVFLADLRLSNPDVDSGVLADYAAAEIAKTGSFKHFIDAYADYIVRAGKLARKRAIKEGKST